MSATYSRRRIAHQALELFFGANKPGDDSARLLPTKGIFRILICRITHSLGNTLLLTPLIRELPAVYPGAEIDVLTRSKVAEEIMGSFPSVRNIYRLPAHAFRHPLRFTGVLRDMRRSEYDLVIDPCPQSQTGRLMQLLARGRYKVGFVSNRKSSRLTHSVGMPPLPMHAGQLPVFLLRAAIGAETSQRYPTVDIGLQPSERQRGLESLRQLTKASDDAAKKKGVIGIFANATGPKLLDRSWWHRFMSVIEPRFSDYSLIEIIPATAESLLDERYPAYYSSDIRKLAGVLSGLSLFISADCGIMHLACASGAPVMAIFTVTEPGEWGPYGSRDRIIHALGLSPEQAAERVVAEQALAGSQETSNS